MAKRIIQGIIRDKERTKAKLLEAVGEITKTKEYTRLKAIGIASQV